MSNQNQNNPGWPPSYPPGYFGPFNPVGPSRNPGGTNPFPLPSELPVPCHDLPITPLAWGAGAVTGNAAVGLVEATTFTATWQSPVFDLRPELRGSSMSAPLSSPDGTVPGVVPIWRQTYGAGGQLFVQVENLLADARSLTGLVVNVIELGHVNDVRRVVSIAQPEDVSSQFTNNQASAVLVIVPPGGGCPMRYWQVRIVFDILTDVTDAPLAGPGYLVSGAYY